ncbi:MAG TPA: endonuclease III [Candidatus Dorea intestinavium]|nr:endonuclease III [Candidatus Dorea intestinavium]
MNTDEILDIIEEMFPDAQCELNHKSAIELIIAVVLSAQATDVSVNKATPALFAAFPTLDDYDKATVEEIESYIKQIGLYHSKARHIKTLTHQLKYEFKGEVPSTMKELTSLAGVGRKSANVVLSVWFGIPALAVDTHVQRVSKRLGLAKPADTVEKVEEKLKRKIKRERWNHAHHLLIFFGRYFCTARNPKCEACPFRDICQYLKGRTK